MSRITSFQFHRRRVLIDMRCSLSVPIVTCLLLWFFQPASHDASAEPWPLFPIVVHGKMGLIDENGTIVLQPEFDYHETSVVGSYLPNGPRHFLASDGMAIIWSNGKAGYVDSTGKIVVRPQFEKAGLFCGACAYASNPDSGIIVLNRQGRAVHSGLEDVRRPQGGVAFVKKGSLWGLLDVKSGEFVVKPTYSEVSGGGPYVEACRSGKWGAIDMAGNTVLPFQYDSVRIVNGLAVIVQDHRCGVYDVEQRELTAPIKFDAISVFREGRFECKANGKWGFIDQNGSIVVPPEYDSVHGFYGGRAWGMKGKQHYLLDPAGCVIASPQFDAISYQGDGYTIVHRKTGGQLGSPERKSGVIGSDGTIIVPFTYDSIGDYANGCAIVGLDGKYGFIDETGTEVLAPSLEVLHKFRGDLAIGGRLGCVGLVGRDGQWVCKPKYHELSYEFGDFRVAQIDPEDKSLQYVGYTDVKGTLLFASRDWAVGEPFHGALARVVTVGDGPAYVNREGQIVWSLRSQLKVDGGGK